MWVQYQRRVTLWSLEVAYLSYLEEYERLDYRALFGKPPMCFSTFRDNPLRLHSHERPQGVRVRHV